MKISRLIIISITLLIVSSIAVLCYAQPVDIQKRIGRQQLRIDQGIASGALTQSEAYMVQDNLNWIRSAFARMKADGILTPPEIGKLEAMLDRNDLMIRNKKHNAIKRVYQADIPQRIDEQQWRINQGIASGALTRGEADVLLDNLNWIKVTFARMKADGILTPPEIGKLEAMLDRNSIMIFNKKHNPIRRVY
jgi:hypothetical protein